MGSSINRRGLLGSAAATLAVVATRALPAAAQRALDVPYVPTPEHVVEAMLKLANPGPGDYLVDLGCGDGRIPITAAQRFRTPGFGVDLNPVRIMEARANAEKAKVTDIVQFVEGDLFKTDFRQATVLTLYLLPAVNMRLRPQILEMKPGTRVVSHAFHFEDWEADTTESYDFRRIYYWVVPAKVAGKWTGNLDGAKFELELSQKFQRLTGSVQVDGKHAPIHSGKVTGDAIAIDATFADGRRRTLEGRLDGTSLSGPGWSVRRS